MIFVFLRLEKFNLSLEIGKGLNASVQNSFIGTDTDFFHTRWRRHSVEEIGQEQDAWAWRTRHLGEVLLNMDPLSAS